ncbi:uncharacterized protein LOC131221119 [Magnolia sinica]|uniref:uncharacterized protein LOC131221119 n=1 Tax=Magnolia sinica TaxID=86752 RepID=UPI002659B8C7|nr:uncharacterized protein LOC131221119 [Magnolia sinica]
MVNFTPAPQMGCPPLMLPPQGFPSLQIQGQGMKPSPPPPDMAHQILRPPASFVGCSVLQLGQTCEVIRQSREINQGGGPHNPSSAWISSKSSMAPGQRRIDFSQ